MKYDNLRAFEKHLAEAKSLHFSPVYLILGKELHECQAATQLLLQFLLPSADMQEFGLSILDGTQVEEEKLKTTLYSYALLTKSRVTWIQQADKLKKSLQESLEKYLLHPAPSHYLILSAPTWQKNTLFYKALEKEGVILEFAEVKPWEKEKQLIEWVNKQVIQARKLISFPVCQALVKRVGLNPQTLAQELEKLMCFCAEKTEITLQDLDQLCPLQPTDSVWQLGESLFRRDPAHALRIAHSLLMEGQALLPLLRQIRSQFQTGYQICLFLAQGKQAQEIAQEYPYMKGQMLEKHLRQAQQYGLQAFKQGLLNLDATEMRTKHSAVDDKILIELLIMQLTNPQI